jgi:hypothetical protein
MEKETDLLEGLAKNAHIGEWYKVRYAEQQGVSEALGVLWDEVDALLEARPEHVAVSEEDSADPRRGRETVVHYESQNSDLSALKVTSELGRSLSVGLGHIREEARYEVGLTIDESGQVEQAYITAHHLMKAVPPTGIVTFIDSLVKALAIEGQN